MPSLAAGCGPGYGPPTASSPAAGLKVVSLLDGHIARKWGAAREPCKDMPLTATGRPPGPGEQRAGRPGRPALRLVWGLPEPLSFFP